MANKFEGGSLDLAGFLAIKDKLTEALAIAFAERMLDMGDDIKGISWFSSCAMEYSLKRQSNAA